MDIHGYIRGYINGYTNGYTKKWWLQLASVSAEAFSEAGKFKIGNGKLQGIS